MDTRLCLSQDLLYHRLSLWKCLAFSEMVMSVYLSYQRCDTNASCGSTVQLTLSREQGSYAFETALTAQLRAHLSRAGMMLQENPCRRLTILYRAPVINRDIVQKLDNSF